MKKIENITNLEAVKLQEHSSLHIKYLPFYKIRKGCSAAMSNHIMTLCGRKISKDSFVALPEFLRAEHS